MLKAGEEMSPTLWVQDTISVISVIISNISMTSGKVRKGFAKISRQKL